MSAVIVGAVLGTVVLLLLIVIVVRERRHKRFQYSLSSDIYSFNLLAIAMSILLYPFYNTLIRLLISFILFASPTTEKCYSVLRLYLRLNAQVI